MHFRTSPFLPRPLFLLLATLLVSSLGSSCSKRPASKGMAERSSAVPVRVAKVQRGDLPRVQSSVGTVQAVRSVAIRSQVDGVLEAVHFKEGVELAAGSLLVSLDRRPFENALAIARAEQANAQAEAAKAAADAERYERLHQDENISRELYVQFATKRDTTRAVLQAKTAAVAQAELHLGYTQIRTPFAGRTGRLLLREGSLLKANDAASTLLTLNQLSPIEVIYTVPERSLPMLREGLATGKVKVTVTVREEGSPKTEGHLTFLDNTIDPSSGTLLLKAEFENPDKSLWPGQFVDVETQLGVDRGVLYVPPTAVQVGQNGQQIYVVRPDATIEVRPARVLRTTSQLALLAEGVSEGETVVTDGHIRLVPGARVEIRKEDTRKAGSGKGAQH